MKTFIILDTPPELNGKTLNPEAKGKNLQGAVMIDLILLERDMAQDIATVARRIQNITFRDPKVTLRNHSAKSAEEFTSIAKTGDRVIVLKANGWDWEQYLVA